MARSLSTAKILSAAIVEGFSASMQRRGLSAAASVTTQGVAKAGAGKSPVMAREEKVAEKVAWIPDPKTGFYRPENQAEEIDVAELRAMLLKKAAK